MKRKIQYPIAESAHGSVMDFLKKEHGVSTRQVRGFRDAGNLLLDGKPVGMRDQIQGYQLLEIQWETEEPLSVEANDLPVEILYEDADILIVNKPSGMPTHPSLGHENDTLAGAVTGHWLRNNESHRFRPIGRLDRETCGLMVIAKSAWVALMLEEQQKNHRMYRSYTAIVQGHPERMTDCIQTPIGRVPGSIILRHTTPDGQIAVTDYKVECIMEKYTGVSLRLTTGRTHQIRVHMASIGHPLVNDGLYNTKEEPKGHLALCSTTLYLMHPVLRVPMQWKIEPIWKNFPIA